MIFEDFVMTAVFGVLYIDTKMWFYIFMRLILYELKNISLQETKLLPKI